MDVEETGGGVAGATRSELFSTGSLTSTADHRTRSRRRTTVLALCCAGLLTGGFAVQRLSAHPGPPSHRTSDASRQASPGEPFGAGNVAVTGRREFVVHSPGGHSGGTTRVVVGAVTRVPTDAYGSALELLLHVDVLTGVETLTTDTFVAADAGVRAAAVTPASAVTVLHPDTHVVPSNGGFRIAAPAKVDVVVIVGVPPGDHVVSIIEGATDRPPPSFTVRG